ncbi:MAG: hypothetical protein Q9209_000636 [Squamulea sp. 1 TL-2023]
MAVSKIVPITGLLILCVAALYFTVQDPSFWTRRTIITGPSHMTFRAPRFTPEVMLSAPRRSPAIPNSHGKLAVYTVSTYSFGSRQKTSEIKVIDITSGLSTLITNERTASDPSWLGDTNELLWLKEGEKGATVLVVGSVEKVGQTYDAGIIPGSISNVKVKELGTGQIAIAFSGKSWPNGTLYNAEQEPKKLTTARLYDSTMVRHWDEYVTPQKNAIWYGKFERSNGRWSLGPVTNALKDTRLESPIPTFGGKDNFDLSSTGLLFVSKDPSLNPAFNTKCNLYFVPINDFSETPTAKPRLLELEALQGAATSPAFSPDGKSATFLQMGQNGYESDRNHVVLVPDIAGSPAETELSAKAQVLKIQKDKTEWDRSPSSVAFSPDGSMLLLVVEDKGDDVLVKFDLKDSLTNMQRYPEPVTGSGAVSDVQPLKAGSNELFISSTNLIDNSIYTVVDPAQPAEARVVSSNSRQGVSFGLSSEQVSEIWFQGAVAWTNSWSTRWNPAVFAEQGYVVICPNPTGSTGYGQAFVDGITESWGGVPYEDLVKGFEYIEEKMPYVDTDRAVALGASYGGYMMNWFQGHPLGRAFKALVCHDGVFSMTNQISSDEQYFPNHDLGGAYWKSRENWERWNPARFTGNWSTPMLVIHNELDFRLPISEGLAMFNVLQERGIDSKFLTFSDENHWVLKEENSLVWHTVVLNWINKYAGLPPFKEETASGVYMTDETQVAVG